MSGAGVTAPAVKEGLPPDTGSLLTVSPDGVSERNASAGNLFGHEEPGKEKNRRQKKKKTRREEL